jgi:RimJ/RimL family protein N-acetyltransferase
MYPLLTERLSIEPLASKDVPDFVAYRQHPDIARFQSWETNYSAKQAFELVQSQTGVLLPDSGQWLQLWVHNLQTGELLGDLAFHRISDQYTTFEIGFTFSLEHQGNGYAKESASKLIGFLLGEAKAEKIIAHTDRRNLSSIRLLSTLGFEQIPSRSWDEEFKNELVTVDYFELNRRVK